MLQIDICWYVKFIYNVNRKSGGTNELTHFHYRASDNQIANSAAAGRQRNRWLEIAALRIRFVSTAAPEIE